MGGKIRHDSWGLTMSSDQLGLPGQNGGTTRVHGTGKTSVQGHLHSTQVGHLKI